jgi:hypothetical protein
MLARLTGRTMLGSVVASARDGGRSTGRIGPTCQRVTRTHMGPTTRDHRSLSQSRGQRLTPRATSQRDRLVRARLPGLLTKRSPVVSEVSERAARGLRILGPGTRLGGPG